MEHLYRYPEERERLLHVLKTPREETRDEDVVRYIEEFRSKGALTAVVNKIEKEAELALNYSILHQFPKLKGVMNDLVEVILGPIKHVMIM